MLDDLDRAIIGVLHANPRATWDDVAAVVGVNASTVSRRYARLVQENIVRVVGEVAWGLYSSTLPVHLRVETMGAPPSEIADTLAGFGNIQHLALAYGRYPLFATLHAPTEERAADLLRSIHEVPGVSSVITLPVLAFAVKGSGWDPQILNQEQSRLCSDALAGSAQPNPMATTLLPGGAQPDDQEKRALALLQQDARATASRIGSELGLAHSTANRMLHRFFSNGWFRPRVEIDGSYLGYGAPFALRAKASHESVAEVCRELAQHPSTRFVTQVASEYNVFCTGLARDRAHLAQLVNEEFGAMAGIRELDVDLFLMETKRFWISRGPEQRLGEFAPPPLL